ncbi:unnamed protein product [Thelazia callipaeda]|uniref:Uncharacterized protein n=1 Tax=Thelazia callipaeda TaxID=103827 RepID=A0A0N5CP12_THECL|nr:unnamed protein product [Thelazia callipaeda]
MADGRRGRIFGRDVLASVRLTSISLPTAVTPWLKLSSFHCFSRDGKMHLLQKERLTGRSTADGPQLKGKGKQK